MSVTAVVVGAATESPRRRPLSTRAARNVDTGELPPVADNVDPEEVRYAPRPPRRHGWARRLAILGLVLVLAQMALDDVVPAAR